MTRAHQVSVDIRIYLNGVVSLCGRVYIKELTGIALNQQKVPRADDCKNTPQPRSFRKIHLIPRKSLLEPGQV